MHDTKQMNKYADSVPQQNEGLVAWEVLLDNSDNDQKQQPTPQQQFDLQNQLEQLLSLFTTTTDPETMYLHQAMKALDQQQLKI